MNLLTAKQMGQLEATAIASGSVTGLELMERAGRGVVDAVFKQWPTLSDQRQKAVILCGPGNNGGDGYVVARLLAERGWDVAVYGVGRAETLPPDAAENRRRWEAMGAVAPLEEAVAGDATLIVDAMFGTGLNRPFVPPDHVGALFQGLFPDGPCTPGTNRPPYVVAIDMPSGLEADSGRVLWSGSPWTDAIAAHLTVTFHQPKLGHMLANGPQRCGGLAVVDIGLEDTTQGVPQARLPDPMRMEPSLSKGAGAHKFHHGSALVVTGGMGRTGAARLAAEGALRIGAGLVTLGTPGPAMMECAVQIGAMMLRKCDDVSALRDLLSDHRVNALCVGPGLGIGTVQREVVLGALDVAARRQANLSVVLDADALSNFAGREAELVPQLVHASVMTPHEGEFARVFPDLADRLNGRASVGPAYSKADAARDASARAGCVVVLKGADTVIAAPDGRVVVHAAAYGRATPWLATAGAGDVLAGIITGLLARGFDPLWAAQAGVFLHADAARAFGPGLMAEDLPGLLPDALRRNGVD